MNIGEKMIDNTSEMACRVGPGSGQSDYGVKEPPASDSRGGQDHYGNTGKALDPQPLKVLLAEPVTRLRNSMVRVLDSLRYEILTATDGFEVLCRLPEWRPDVLLMSGRLPRINGMQVCSLLRDSPDFHMLPIILLVDEDAFLETAKATEAGADACLRRPFRLNELLGALTRIGERRTNDSWLNVAEDTPSSPASKGVGGEDEGGWTLLRAENVS